MFRYYQTREDGKWRVLPDTDVTNEKLAEVHAKRLSILAVSQVVDEFTKKDELSYKGPLYFDIDCKEDIYEAIKSCRALVEKLRLLDVVDEAVEIYCSGSKGLHVIVDSRAFYSGRATKNLPLVYKEIAKDVYVFGMDYQVYSQGRGVAWRLVNVKRDDGNYRVRITMEELNGLTIETYRELVKAPREMQFPPNEFADQHAYKLTSLFERAKLSVKEQKKLSQTYAKTSREEGDIMKALEGVTPQCVTDLIEGKTDGTKNFNQIALQAVAYASAAGMDTSQAKDLLGPFSETSESSAYSTPRERFQHAVGLFRYIKSSTSFTFTCGGICSVIDTKPCRECPVTSGSGQAFGGNKRAIDEGAGIEEKLQESIDIAVRYDGYYAVSGDTERKLSTYTMEVTDYHEEAMQDGSGYRITGYLVMLRIEIDGKMEYREVHLAEEGFLSRAALNAELKGIAGAVFYGSDTDAIKLKAFITSDQMRTKANKIITSYVAGIVTHPIGQSHLHVYVDPDGSINEFKVQGTHYLNSDLIAPPEFFKVGIPPEGDPEMKHVIDTLLDLNSELTIACLIGWHTAVHFKSHIMSRHSQFPLLSLWGPAGVGKTQTAVKFCFLNGCDFKTKYTPVITSNATPWALVDYCSSTSTAPRILDEANESKMDRRLYEKFAEVVKAAFNSSTIARGTIQKAGSANRGRTGAKTVSIPISSPIVMLSEQSQTMPAIQQRSLEVFLSEKGKKGKRPQFRELVGKEHMLMSVGKAMMFKALGTSVEYVCGIVERYMPLIDQDMDDRTIFSYATALAGLELFSEITQELGFDYAHKCKSLQKVLLTHINISKRDEILQSKLRSEVDIVVDTMSIMAQLTSTGSYTFLTEGVHYSIREGVDLLIDYKAAFPMYLQYCRRQNEKIIIKSLGQFLTLIREEPYYEDEEPPSVRSPRPLLVLNTINMHKKGIDPTLFSPEAEIV